MSEEEIRRASNAMVEFEAALADILLSAFAAGATVEREWRVSLPVAEAPDWIVTVKRVDPEGGYEPTLFEE